MLFMSIIIRLIDLKINKRFLSLGKDSEVHLFVFKGPITTYKQRPCWPDVLRKAASKVCLKELGFEFKNIAIKKL